MLTDKDIQKIVKANQQIFATKKDLENFATKKDLKDFATREDLKVFITKDDFESFRKENIQKTIHACEKIFATKEDFADFRDEMRKNFSDMLSAVDTYSKKADGYFQEMVFLAHKIERHEKWIHKVADKLGVKLEY